MTENRATLEIIAPTIEEAMEKGLTDLGLTEADVDIEVLDEGSQGLFGLGSRQARIMLIVRGASVSEESAVPEPGTEPKAKELEVTLVQDDNDLIETAQGIVTDLLEKMKLENARVKSYLGEPYGPHERIPIHVDISGDDLSILIGHRGETLDSFQYIARLMMGKELERSVPLIVDVEGYRGRREQQIRRLARSVADQVVQSNRSQSLEPMPANERRIAHIELQEDKEVYTESAGVGRHRKVVIYPSD
jgi:spoIIIJ-associated protein